VSLEDTNQNFWQLASIQGAALGLPVIVMGEILTRSYGAGTALISVALGNLILWVIGLAMISMTYSSRSHAIQNIKVHLGRIPSWFGIIVLVLAFLTWFSFQLKGMTTAYDSLMIYYPYWNSEWSLKVGAFSGCIISLLAIGGIRLIRWVCVGLFPLLFLYTLYALFTSVGPSPIFAGTWGLSLPAIVLATSVTLPGMINIPTFFRHARSKQDAFLGLTLMVLFTIGFQSSSIYLRFLDISQLVPIYSDTSGSTFSLTLVIAFIALSTLCINLVNIYFASAALEMLHSKTDIDSKTYTLLGLAGTLLYGIVQIGYIMQFVEDLTTCYISILGITLLQAYLTEIIVKHRARTNEKIVNSLCFFVGCIASTFVLVDYDITKATMAGVGASLFAFILIMFCEETYWSFIKLRSQ